MIEISCTETQKKKIIEALRTMDTPCLFPHRMKDCAYHADMDCRKCLENGIKWRIQTRQKKGDAVNAEQV